MSFYLDECQGIRDIYYVRSDQVSSETLRIERKNLHSIAAMVWAGVSSHGKIQMHFIEHGTTITGNYYIEHV